VTPQTRSTAWPTTSDPAHTRPALISVASIVRMIGGR
jgi:hypothetical protein